MTNRADQNWPEDMTVEIGDQTGDVTISINRPQITQEIIDRHSMKLSEIRNDCGELPEFAWPGGYPIFYLASDNGILCPKCANAFKAGRDNDAQLEAVAYMVHYEGPAEQCENCNTLIESAYGDPEQKPDQSQMPYVWQLAPDSDPSERFIVVTADGENELSGILETREDGERWIREHVIPCTASSGECKCLDCWKE